MKKVWFIFLIIIIMLQCTGCVTDKSKQASNLKSKEIIRCFDEKDVDGLKELFCQNSHDNYNLDEEIQNAMDFYEGKSMSYNLKYGGVAGGYDNGVCVDEHITPEIRDIKTSDGKIYNI